MANTDVLVWVDCEMTGLDLGVDELVEVAVVVTDYSLTPLDDGLDVVIKPSAAALANMGEFVTKMHTESGLIEELRDGLPLEEAERLVLDYIRRFAPEPKTAPLAGNTIGTDRAFIGRHMPLIEEHLHYRSVDVSSIKELARRWYPRAWFQAPEKHGGHRALADILESIRELEYYRRVVFVPAQPGPTSDEAAAAARAVVSEWGPRLS